MEFSVLMSVYYREKPEYLDQSLKSVLRTQSIIPNEFVIVKDGPLNSSLDQVIKNYSEDFKNIIKVVELPENVGLGKALMEGLKLCKYNLVARMDSDDINHSDRFKKQLEVFSENEHIDLVGGNISEFFREHTNIAFIRSVPSENIGIKKMMKHRNPINHVSVMFKKNAVLAAGGYKHLSYLEDYYLWIRMIANNSIFFNLNENLVYVRTGEEMYRRRSNPEYIRSWFELQKKLNEFQITNRFDFVLNMINIIVFIYTPPKLKELIYKFFLRKK